MNRNTKTLLSILVVTNLIIAFVYFLYLDLRKPEPTELIPYISFTAEKTCGGIEKVLRVNSTGFECKWIS